MKALYLRRLFSTLEITIALFVTLAVTATADAQWLERTIYLPDSFAVGRPLRIAYNQPANRMYVAGEAGRVLVIDASTDQRIACINAGRGIEALLYNPHDDKLYTANYDDSTVTIIDCVVNAPVTTLDVGAGPTDLVFNSIGNKIYCANKISDNVTVIDGAADIVVATVPAGDEPWYLAYDSTDNRVFVTCKTSRHLIAIDGGADTVLAQIPTGRQPGVILWNPVGNRLYHSSISSPLDKYVCIRNASTYDLIAAVSVGMYPRALCLNTTNNKVYSMNPISGDVSVIDGAGDSLLTSIDLGGGLNHMAYNQSQNKLYCARQSDIVVVNGSTDSVIDSVWIGSTAKHVCISAQENKVYCAAEDIAVIDCIGDTVLKNIEVMVDPAWLAWSAAHTGVYCTNHRAPPSDVIVINGTTFEVTDRIPVFRNPSASLLNESVDKLYCSNTSDSAISVVDCAANVLCAVISLPWGHYPYAFASNTAGDKVYCSHTGGPVEGAVSVLDAYGDSIIATIPVSGLPYQLLWYPPGGKLYCGTTDSIYVIDGAGDTVLHKIPIWGGGFYFVWDSSDDKIYFTNPVENEVGVLDPAGDTVTSRIAVGQGPAKIAWNATDNKVYSANWSSGDVSIIDCARDSVVAVLPVARPFHMLWNQMSDKVYVSSRSQDLVVIIDGTTDDVVQRIGVGLGPEHMCLDPVGNRLFVVNGPGSSISVIKDPVGIREEVAKKLAPRTPSLRQNLPNPFHHSTAIRYSLPMSCFLNLSVYDVSGRLVEVLVDEHIESGTYQSPWDASNQPSGIYFYRLKAGDFAETRKLILLR